MSLDFLTFRQSENTGTARINDPTYRCSILGLESNSEMDDGKILIKNTANGAPIYDRNYGNHGQKNEARQLPKKTHGSVMIGNLGVINDNERYFLKSPTTSPTFKMALSPGTSHTLATAPNPNRNELGNPQGNSNTFYRTSIAENMHDDQDFRGLDTNQSKGEIDTMNTISDPS
jgi:hypothetical protein